MAKKSSSVKSAKPEKDSPPPAAPAGSGPAVAAAAPAAAAPAAAAAGARQAAPPPILRHKSASKVQTTVTHLSTYGPRPHAFGAGGWADFDIEIDSIPSPDPGPPIKVTVKGSATTSQGVTLSATCTDANGNDIGALTPPAPTFDPGATTWTHNQFTNANLAAGNTYLYTVTGTLVTPGTPTTGSPGTTSISSTTTTVSASAFFSV